MADLTIYTGDTYPSLKGNASDENGLVDLTTADLLTVLLKGTSTLITGTATVIDPGEVDGADTWNWQYVWAAGDTSIADTYTVQLKVTWDAAATPPAVEYFTSAQKVVIKQSNG